MMDEQSTPSYVISEAQKAKDQQANEDAGLKKNTLPPRDFIAEIAQAGAAQVQEISLREKAKQLRSEGGGGRTVQKMKEVADTVADYAVLVTDARGQEDINRRVNKSVNLMADRITAKEREAEAYVAAKIASAKRKAVNIGAGLAFDMAVVAADVAIPSINFVDRNVARVRALPQEAIGGIRNLVARAEGAVATGLYRLATNVMERATGNRARAVVRHGTAQAFRSEAQTRGVERQRQNPKSFTIPART